MCRTTGDSRAHAASTRTLRKRPPRMPEPRLVLSRVILQAQVGDLLFAHEVTKRVLELGLLNEQVVLGLKPRRSHRALVIERKPFLDSFHACASREIGKESEVENDRRCKNR